VADGEEVSERDSGPRLKKLKPKLKLKPQKRKKPDATETNHRLAFAYKCVWSRHSRGQNTRVNVKGSSGESP